MVEQKINKINLNLLFALNALLTHQSVTLAAKSCNVTQSAMSLSLKQLREIFNDQLLIRGRAGNMHLTNRGASLLEQTRDTLHRLQVFFHTDPTVDLKKAKRNIRIGTQEYISAWFLPKIMQALAEHAPGITITIVNNYTPPTQDDFLQHKYDLAISLFNGNDENLHSNELFSDSMLCVAHPDHQIWDEIDNFDLMALGNYKHVVWAQKGNQIRDALDQWYLSHDMVRPVYAVTPNTSQVFQLVEQTDLVGFVMGYSNAIYGKHYNFKSAQVVLPEDFICLNWKLIWHEISNNDPVLDWMRKLIMEIRSQAEFAQLNTAKN